MRIGLKGRVPNLDHFVLLVVYNFSLSLLREEFVSKRGRVDSSHVSKLELFIASTIGQSLEIMYESTLHYPYTRELRDEYYTRSIDGVQRFGEFLRVSPTLGSPQLILLLSKCELIHSIDDVTLARGRLDVLGGLGFFGVLLFLVRFGDTLPFAIFFLLVLIILEIQLK